jgi:hypothetical protein
MLSYEISEAETLLEGKLATAKLSLSNCEEDLEFLREQITVSAACAFCTMRPKTDPMQTMEVAIARVYNWEVVQKRKEKGDEKAGSTEDDSKDNGEPDG